MRLCRGCGEETGSALRLCRTCASTMDLGQLKALCEQLWPVESWPTGPGRMTRMTLRETKDGQRLVKAKRRATA